MRRTADAHRHGPGPAGEQASAERNAGREHCLIRRAGGTYKGGDDFKGYHEHERQGAPQSIPRPWHADEIPQVIDIETHCKATHHADQQSEDPDCGQPQFAGGRDEQDKCGECRKQRWPQQAERPHPPAARFVCGGAQAKQGAQRHQRM